MKTKILRIFCEIVEYKVDINSKKKWTMNKEKEEEKDRNSIQDPLIFK